MKIWLWLCLFLGLSMASTFGQGAQADQIKRRARGVAEQNNARQGVPPAAPPSAAPVQRSVASPAAPASVVPQLSPEQKRAATIRSELALLATTNSPDARKRFSKALLSGARGTGKPTGAAADQVSEQMAAALAGTKLSPAQLDRLAQNLDGAMNAGPMPKSQADAIADDVRAVLEKAGGDGQRAAKVAAELRRVAAEIQKGSR